MERHVFDTFSSEDLLKGNKWRGRPLSDNELATIREEAVAFKSSQIWKILKAELEWFALKSLMEKGEDGEDIRVARAFGNIVRVVDKKLKEISDGS